MSVAFHSELYSEQAVAAGITTHKADMIFASLPYRILPDLQVPVYAQMKERDKELYDRLEKAGFMLDFGDDDSGLFLKSSIPLLLTLSIHIQLRKRARHAAPLRDLLVA